MTERLFALNSHLDMTRFEVEDGLLRNAAADLLSNESAIETITIDIGLQRLPESVGEPLGTIDSLFLIKASNPDDATPAHFEELVASTASVAGSWTVETIPVTRLKKSWSGTATPGPKLNAFFRTDKTGDTSRERIVDVTGTIAADLGDVGSRVTFVSAGQEAPFESAISLWFADVASAKDALAGPAYTTFFNSSLVDRESLGLYRTTEHVLTANPNIWSTTTGVRPPQSG